MRRLKKDGFNFHCFITTVVVLRLCRIMGNNRKRKRPINRIVMKFMDLNEFKYVAAFNSCELSLLNKVYKIVT